MQSGSIKKIYFLPNVLTALGLTCGLYVIFRLNMTEVGEVTEWLLVKTAGLLILAAFFDILDGALARAMSATSEFGGIFDSMSDAISFGVAPSVIVMKSLSFETGSFESFLITISALVFSVCGVLRLVRFSSKEMKLPPSKNFSGLPIPAAGGALVALNLFLVSSDLQSWLHMSKFVRLLILSLAMLLLGYLMVSRWKFLSAKRLAFHVKNFQVVFFIVLGAVLLFYGLLNHFAFVMFLLSWSYIFVALALSIARLIAGRKSKALEDFERDPEDF